MDFKWLLEFVKTQGPVIGILLGLIIWESKKNDSLLKRIIESKENEIKRLAADNRAYREVYLKDIVKIDKNVYDAIIPPDDGLESRSLAEKTNEES